ncbi:hypothetical protein Rrhod_2203 [Rhodococcus rhodnii LMG 5362]|uniref:Uncharacterized protein n=1 Tax=Rhodococcus rhodnii LMG 5362 TaxID=1273125 RepID=R7WMB2_9NOCA|nr:hypothetical protein Rrhod_2203 [Rhodococcus rhodnii LMG 5362]
MPRRGRLNRAENRWYADESVRRSRAQSPGSGSVGLVIGGRVRV